MFRSRRRAHKAARILCIISILTFSVGDFARADLVWDGSTDSTWSDFSNWTPTASETAAPVAGDTAVFSGAGNGNTTIDLSTAATVDTLVFDTGSAAAYTIGAGAVGTDTLTLGDNGETANLRLTSTVANDQTINANILLGPDAAIGDYQFDLDSTTNKLIIAGNIDTAAGGTAGVKRLEFGDFNTTDIGTVDITGNISNTGAATRIELYAAGANINLSGTVAQTTGNVMRTFIRDNGTITVSGTGLLGKGEIDVRYGTLNLNNTTTNQRFENTLTLGDLNTGNGNAAVNIASGATLELATGLTYLADNNTANVGTVSGGTLQITGANRTFIANDNSLIAASSPELTISSTITNDGSDRDLTIRNTGGGTLRIAPTLENNTFGAINLQEGTLQLGNGALDTGGDFLTIAARNAGATAANTVATIDLLGSTNTVNDINFGNDATTNIVTNGFQGSIIDSVGGGKLTDANIIRFRKGTGTGVQRNGAAVLSADVDFDASGNSKQIIIQDGSASTDLTITSALNTAAGETDDDFEFIGDGTLQISGTLGNAGTLNGHDQTLFRNKKTILAAGADLGGVQNFHIGQRNAGTFSDFEVEFDINGQDLTLDDQLIVSNGSTGSVTSIQSTRITDSAGGGVIVLTGNTVGAQNNVIYNAGTGATNKTTFIEADLRFENDGFTITVNDGADAIDLDISGQIDTDTGTRFFTKGGAGALKLSATNNNYGVITVNNGTLQITNAGALGSDRIQLGSNTNDGTLEYIGSGDTISEEIRVGDNSALAGRVGGSIIENNGTGGLTFDQSNFNQARTAVTVARTLEIGGTNSGGDNTISGIIRDNNTGGGGTVAVTKTGTNTWNLNGNNLYTGATAVNAGQLNINGTNASSITVASGANLGGEGSTTGSLVFSGTTHTINADLSTGAALGSTTSTDVSALNIGGFTVNVTGTGTGAVDVLTYGTTFTGALDRFVLGTGTVSARGATFGDSGTAITLDAGFVTNTWQGTDGTNPAFWDINTTANWSNSADAIFQDGDDVIFGDSATDFTPTLQQNVTAGTVTFANDATTSYTLSAAAAETLTINTRLQYASSVNGTINAVIAGSGSLLKGDNSDGIQELFGLTLSGANTYSGGTTIDEGTIFITNNSALGTGTVTMSDGAGANNQDPILNLDQASGFDFTNDFVLSNAGGGKIIRFDNSGTNTGTLSGNISLLETTLSNNRFEAGVNDTLTITGLVSGSAGSLTKRFGGTLILDNAANSFNHLVAGNGTVEVASIGDQGVNSHAGAGDRIVLGYQNESGDLAYTGGAMTTDRQVQVGNRAFGISNYTGAGRILNNGTGAMTFTNAAFSFAESKLAAQIGARTLGLGGTYTGGTNEIQGSILNNFATDGFVDETVAVNVEAGTWAFSGVNSSYSGGTTVMSGATLLVNNATGSGTGTGTVTVDAGGTLGGSGIISGATTISGTHGPGESPGIQTFGNDLTYNAGSNIAWELVANTSDDTGGVRGTDFDGIDFDGTLTFNATTTLDFNFGGTVNFGDIFWTNPAGVSHDWTIFSDTTGANISGIGNLAFNGNGQTAPAAGVFTISVNGSDVVLNYTLTAVPEGSTFMMFCMAFGLFGFGRRRKAIATA